MSFCFHRMVKLFLVVAVLLIKYCVAIEVHRFHREDDRLLKLTPTCADDEGCLLYNGPVGYIAIGNSMSSPGRTGCRQKAESSAELSLPSTATIVQAFLQWSGSGNTGNYDVLTLNGQSIAATSSFENSISLSTPTVSVRASFYGAHVDVTSLVSGSGLYTISDMVWDTSPKYCDNDLAFGAWSLVVIYSDPTIENRENRIHLCQETFMYTFPNNEYQTTIGCIQASDSCPQQDAELTLITFESDKNVGEELFIGGTDFGNTWLDESTAPDLDIDTFNISGLIDQTTTELNYDIVPPPDALFSNKIDGVFSFVKVLSYPSFCNSPPVAKCTDLSICSGTLITAAQVGSESWDADGDKLTLALSNYGPFPEGSTRVRLTAIDRAGLSDTCLASITNEDCQSVKTCTSNVTSFKLIDSEKDRILGDLGSTLDYGAYYRQYYNILADVAWCPGDFNRSVLFELDGEKSFCDRSGVFALLGDSPNRNFLGRMFFLREQPYIICATPYASADCSGEPAGLKLSQRFAAVGPGGFKGSPGAPVYFELYNADIGRRVSEIRDGDEICRPDFNVTIKAIVIDSEDSRVVSVRFDLVVGRETFAPPETYTSSNRPDFFLYGTGASGTLNGKEAEMCLYTLTATSFSGEAQGSRPGASYSATFSFVDCTAT